MKYPIKKDSNKLPSPLKLLGRRVFISLDLVPFMHMLRPLALSLATLRNPPGMVYTRKVFKHLKRILLQRSFKNRFLKNQQMAKFLLRGFQSQFIEKNKKILLYPRFNEKITNKFNLNCVKEYFQSIEKYEEQKLEEVNQKITFLKSIPFSLQRRRQSDFNCSLRIRKVLEKMIKRQKSQEIQVCQRIYKNEFLKIRIPWTENIYQEIKTFGEQIWMRYKNRQFNLLTTQRELSSEDSNQIQEGRMRQLQKEKKIIKKLKNQDKKRKFKEQEDLFSDFLTLNNQENQNQQIFFSSFENDNQQKSQQLENH